ncbi:DUF1269 domain-containing protein [Streptomyces sp. NPDC052309]|uniref:DUF1269 domain-containing protein n=1 Tax=Streptomyces griseicoloratus TaxID=2752516 RepID=A0A926LC22_9ACTN|nr:DUF1269 domain-containing protein [Streptomyces griseicoloratus]MBD0423897.1 DUF1269 domain-containing protein [Streptomyces griseicoloratus]
MAATLTAWKFPNPEGAEHVEQTLLDLQKQGLIQVHDAAVVSWPEDRKQPKTKQLHNLAATGALSGTFWGMLFGLIFFVPLLGAALGALSGALGGSLADVGIDDDFIDSVRGEVTPGSSALFLLTSEAVVDRVHEAFPNGSAQLISSNLSHDDERKLREVFEA